MTCTARTIERGKRIRHLSLPLMIALFLLASCAAPPKPIPEPEEEQIADPVIPESEPVLVQVLEPESEITGQEIAGDGPWELVQRAEQATLDVAIDLRLDAIDGFLEGQDFTHAETQTNFLLDIPLNQSQMNRFNLQRGRIALGFGEYQIAIQYLEPLTDSSLWSPEEWALVLKSLADAQLGLDRRVDALTNLLLRDQLLIGEEQLSNQQRLIDLLEQSSSLEQVLLKQNSHNLGLPTNLVDGWLSLMILRQLPKPERVNALAFWFNSYPGHPGRNHFLGGTPLALNTFNHISLLLPFTSPFGNAAQAFHEGFQDAYNLDTRETKPAVSLVDIGQDPSLSTFYYRSAVAAGADFVVGPLGKEATTTLLQHVPLDTPTLVLADIPMEHSSEELYGLSLSPELEAEQVAFRAFADGHRQAGIFHDGSNWGTRTTKAFTETWLSLGGTVVANGTYSDVIEDYSRLIPQFLEVDKSVIRRKILSATVGLNLEFTPRRRDDLDMLFLVGDAPKARLLVPQLRFFQAHNLPIYSTSNIFSGKPDPAVDADLDGLIFGDMPWMLDIRYSFAKQEPTTDSTHNRSPNVDSGTSPTDQQGIGKTAVSNIPYEASQPETGADRETTNPSEQPLQSDGLASKLNNQLTTDNNVLFDVRPSTPKVVQQPIKKSPFSFTPLDRLYALGFETYHLIPRLPSLRSEVSQQYYGHAFRASVRADGNVIRHLEWARFVDGHVTPLGITDTIFPPPVTLHSASSSLPLQ